MSEILINGDQSAGDSTNLNAFVDTASPHITIPVEAGNNIFGRIAKVLRIALPNPPRDYSPPEDTPSIFAFPCATPPEISLVIEGHIFAINPADMRVAELDSKGRPLSDINVPGDEGNGMVPKLDDDDREVLESPDRVADPYCLSPFVASNANSGGEYMVRH